MALGQEVTAQAIGDLARVDAVIFFLGRGNCPEHERMRHFHCCSVRFQVIVDPAGKDRPSIAALSSRRRGLGGFAATLPCW